MSATIPDPTPLRGRFIELRAMTEADLPELHAAIAHPEIFAGGYGGGPAGLKTDEAQFVEWAHSYYVWDVNQPYAIRVVGGEHDGVLIGTSTLGDFDTAREHAHIGWTAYDPRVWGTQVNAEAKLLLLGRAFDAGFGRVKIQTDILNERSRAAVLKLGATYEGVVRRDVRGADGSWRDTTVYSVLIDEWPGVKAGLEARLDAAGSEPIAWRSR